MALNPKITDWRGKSVWLVGASTGIGAALAHAMHARDGLVLCRGLELRLHQDDYAGELDVEALTAGLDLKREASEAPLGLKPVDHLHALTWGDFADDLFAAAADPGDVG